MNRQEFVLEGLFLHVVRAGFRLGVRDYEDALRALRAGHGLGSRESLLWLCRTLWARSNEEVRLLNLLFQHFPFPTPEEVRAATGAPPEPDESERPRAGEGPDPGPSRPDPEQRRPKGGSAASSIQFTPPSGRGIPLDRARAEPRGDEVFVLTPRPVVSPRALIIIWRRFRVAKREGPRVELDLDATIREQCRAGRLTEPVLVPARRNQARLVVLMDASNSMLPWREFRWAVADSLRKGHLGRASVYYFHNTPSEVLYERETLTKPVAVGRALREHPASTLLVFSDAGAARGSNRRERVRETGEFLSRVRGHWQPVVWMNPMPPRRWAQTSAEKIARLPNNVMLQLGEDGLVKAIDVLRGKQPS